MLKDFTPGIDMPNNMKPKNYPQKFVYSNAWPHNYDKINAQHEYVSSSEILSQVMPKL